MQTSLANEVQYICINCIGSMRTWAKLNMNVIRISFPPKSIPSHAQYHTHTNLPNNKLCIYVRFSFKFNRWYYTLVRIECDCEWQSEDTIKDIERGVKKKIYAWIIVKSFDESSLSAKLNCRYCVIRSVNVEKEKSFIYLSKIKIKSHKVLYCRSLVFTSLTPKEVFSIPFCIRLRPLCDWRICVPFFFLSISLNVACALVKDKTLISLKITSAYVSYSKMDSLPQWKCSVSSKSAQNRRERKIIMLGEAFTFTQCETWSFCIVYFCWHGFVVIFVEKWRISKRLIAQQWKIETKQNKNQTEKKKTCSRWEIVSRLKPPFLLRLDFYRMIKHTSCEALMETSTNKHAFWTLFFTFCHCWRKKETKNNWDAFISPHVSHLLRFYSLNKCKKNWMILYEVSKLSAQHINTDTLRSRNPPVFFFSFYKCVVLLRNV